MAMTEFEKKLLNEVKGINKELHELNRTLKKEVTIKVDDEVVSEINPKQIARSVNDSLQTSTIVNGF